jgi:hypothetical protein
MIYGIQQWALHHLRFFASTPKDLAYLWRIKRSEQFDRAFYRAHHPGLSPLFLKYPERHFIAYGEAAGFYPCPDFSPKAYLRQNRNIPASDRPFDHFLRTNGRTVRDPVLNEPNATPLPAILLRAPQAKYAAVVHVYYANMWPEILHALQASGLDFDLFVTITQPEVNSSTAIETRILADWPNAQIYRFPNHGRDIFPFTTLVNAGCLDGYSAICKLHTKLSPHLPRGADWRQNLIKAVLPNHGSVERIAAFDADADAGLLVAQGELYRGARWWGPNQARTATLLARANAPFDPENLRFPAGSIYWIKAPVVAKIKAMALSHADFDREQGATDGTTAHAFERAIGYLTAAAGLEMRETPASPNVQHTPARPSRVFLHIGTHKTATSSVQATLFHNRKALARHGVIYPNLKIGPAHHGLISHRNSSPGISAPKDGAAAMWKTLVKDHARAGQTLLLSSEEFSRPPPTSRIDYEEIRSWLDEFDEVQILCCLRDQTSFLQSIYLQVARMHGIGAFGAFLRGALQTNRATGLWLDYTQIYHALRQGFAPTEITFLDFAASCSSSGGISGAILGPVNTGLKQPINVNLLLPVTTNVSLNPLATWLAGSLSDPAPPPERLQQIITQTLVNKFGNGGRSTLYTRDEIVQMAVHFAPLNARFLAEIRPFQPDFSLSPPIDYTTHIHREDLKPDIWQKIALDVFRESQVGRPARK